MTLNPTSSKPLCPGFSLPEITISIGIVATILLPILAILAQGSSTEASIDDRQVTSRIALSVFDSLIRHPDGFFELAIDEIDNPEQIDPPSAGQPTQLHLILDRQGNILSRINLTEYDNGISPSANAFYAVRLSLEETATAFSSSVGAEPLLRLAIEIGQPAVAPAESRVNHALNSFLAPP